MGYHIFKGLCSADALPMWKDSRPSTIGGPGQLCWVESEQRWVDCSSLNDTNSAAAKSYQPGEMVWFESIQRWVCADNIESGDYTGFSESIDADPSFTVVITDDYLSDINR